MDFQSVTDSPRRMHTDSREIRTIGGGIAIDLSSTVEKHINRFLFNFFFFMAI